MSNDERDTPDSDQLSLEAKQNGGPTSTKVTAAIASAIEAFGGLPSQAPEAVEFEETAVARPKGVAIEFRVVRPGIPVRRLKLTGNRYTFGSGEGCSIQLDDETLRPMHAVLLRDAHRILMRAYSVPLECNGERVAETELRVGDVIRMGSYRFELLSGPTSQFGHAPSDAEHNQALQRRLTDLSQQWHARHAECEVRESRCDQRESELHSRESELWQRAERLQRREHLLLAQESAAKEIQQTYETLQSNLAEAKKREDAANESLEQSQSKLAATEEQLRERQSELASRRDEWRRREEEFVARTEDTQRKLEQAQDQAQAAGDAVTKMRSEFATLNEQLTELREQHQTLQEREQQEQQEHARLREVLEAARDEAIEAESRSKSQWESAESARKEAEENLEQLAGRLSETQAQLDLLRQESKSKQLELVEKLRETGEELQSARAEAEQTRQESDLARELAEQSGQELETVKRELADARSRAEKARNEADFARSEAEKLLTKAERVRTEADEAQREAQVAHEEAENAKVEAQAARDRAEEARLEAERARDESENTRLEAEQARNEIGHLQRLQTQHAEAEERIKHLSIQLSNLQSNAGDEEVAAQETIARLQEELALAQASKEESFQAAEQLRSQLHVLEERYSKANLEAERLQGEFEGAQASIRQLELLVDQTQEKQSSQSNSWSEEAEQLQKTIDELSDQLSRANAELSELRTSNDALKAEIDSASPPTAEDDAQLIDIDRSEFESLESELAAAQQEIELLKISHAETLAKIKNEREENEHALRDEIEQLRQEIAAAQSWAAQAASEVSQVETTEESSDEAAFVGEEVPSMHEETEQTDDLPSEPSTRLEDSVTSAWATAGYLAGADSAQWESVDEEPQAEVNADASTAQVFAEQEEPGHDPQFHSTHDEASDSGWSNVDWNSSGDASDFESDANLSEASPSGEAADPTDDEVQWHDEQPEESVSHIIDELEESVGEAISDLIDESPEQVSISDDEPESAEVEDGDPSLAELNHDSGARFDDDRLGDSLILDGEQALQALQDQPHEPYEVDAFGSTELDSDTSLGSDESSQSVSDSALVRQLIDASDAASDATAEPPSDWSAYMPGGDLEAPIAGEADYEHDESSFEETNATQQLSAEGIDDELNDDHQPPASDEASVELSDSDEPGEAFDVSGSLTTGPTQAWSATAAFAAEEAPDPTFDANATQQWSTIYDVGGSRDTSELGNSQADGPSSEEAASSQVDDSDLVGENDAPPEPARSDSQASGNTTGSLAEMLIQDLERENDPSDSSGEEAPISASWYADSDVDGQSVDGQSVEVQNNTSVEEESVDGHELTSSTYEEEDPSEQTFVMDAAPESELAEPTTTWHLESPELPEEESEDADAENATEMLSEFEPSVEEPLTQPEATVPVQERNTETVYDPDDDSIEAYMNRLLQRVQGGPIETPTTTTVPETEEDAEEMVDAVSDDSTTPSLDEQDSLETSIDEPESESSEPISTESKSDTPPVARRSQAELTRNLLAMRELANQSARNAVARSILIQARDTQMKAMFKGGFAALLAVFAIGIYFFISISLPVKLIAIGCLLVLAAIFGNEAFIQARDARRRLSLANDGIETEEQKQSVEEEMRRIVGSDDLGDESSQP